MKVDKNKIDIARARKKMSVALLSARLKITRGSYHAIVNNKYKNNKPETVGRLAEVLGVDVTEILQGEAV